MCNWLKCRLVLVWRRSWRRSCCGFVNSVVGNCVRFCVVWVCVSNAVCVSMVSVSSVFVWWTRVMVCRCVSMVECVLYFDVLVVGVGPVGLVVV